MNIERLRKIQQAITEHPEQFSMGSWGVVYHGCMTTGCIAGWAINLFSDAVQQSSSCFTSMEMVVRDRPSTLAADLLNLTFDQRQKLFYVNKWPRDLMARFFDAPTCRRRAALAVELIDRMIAEEEKKQTSPAVEQELVA